MLVSLALGCAWALSGQPTESQSLNIVLDPLAVQKRLEKDPRANFSGAPYQVTPLFEFVDSVTGQRVGPSRDGSGRWVARFDLPPTGDARLLHRLYLVPLPEAGPDARRALAVLQELWAQSDPWPLVSSAPAWAWGARDPRFDAAKSSLTLTFP
jgi:hypothetical protein